MPVLSGRGPISWLYCLGLEDSNRKGENRGRQNLARALINWDIQVFLGFANFYRRFIKGFSKIAAPLTSMLKITALSVLARPVCPRANKNQLDTDGDGNISGGKDR